MRAKFRSILGEARAPGSESLAAGPRSQMRRTSPRRAAGGSNGFREVLDDRPSLVRPPGDSNQPAALPLLFAPLRG